MIFSFGVDMCKKIREEKRGPFIPDRDLSPVSGRRIGAEVETREIGNESKATSTFTWSRFRALFVFVLGDSLSRISSGSQRKRCRLESACNRPPELPAGDSLQSFFQSERAFTLAIIRSSYGYIRSQFLFSSPTRRMVKSTHIRVRGERE